MMVDSYIIPWLIWIQMFVFFLLLILLCIFGIFSSDISDNSCSSADSGPSTSGSPLSLRFMSGDPISISHHDVQSNQAIRGEIRAAETRRDEEEGSLDKDLSHNLHHPCSFFRHAGSVFLKCFGLDPSTEETEDSLRPESKKQR